MGFGVEQASRWVWRPWWAFAKRAPASPV